MSDTNITELFLRSNKHIAITMTCLGTIGTYYYLRRNNIAIGTSFLLPALLAFLPIHSVSYLLFVNKNEDAKFREIMIK